jgi:hypothetical protein
MAFPSQYVSEAGHENITADVSLPLSPRNLIAHVYFQAPSEFGQVDQPLEPTTVLPADDWHPGKDYLLSIQTDQALKSASRISSAVDDVGDSLQLKDVAVKRLSRNGQSAIDYVGTHLLTEDDGERPSSITDDLENESPEALQYLIRGFMLAAAGSQSHYFLPLSELDSIINLSNIEKELRRLGLISEAKQLARQVWSSQTLPTGKVTTRRRIFAILCMIDKATKIQDFITEDVYDSDLPFQFDQTRILRRSGAPLNLFSHWEPHCRDIFHNYQGCFLAPYFKFMVEKFREYELHRCVILPFLEAESAHISPILTYFSEVRRVKIHTAHHDYCMVSVSCKFNRIYWACYLLLRLGGLGEGALRSQAIATS